MKKISLFTTLVILLTVSLVFASCTTNVNAGTQNEIIKVDTDGDGDADSDFEVDENGTPIDGMFKDFYRYKTNGRENANGNLTITNQLTTSVLVFEGELKAENYIGTITGASSLKVILKNTEKFESLIAISLATYANNYEKYKTVEVAFEKTPQSQALAYYSPTQTYTVSVSPKNLLGGGTWVFNNNTNYWVDVQCVDNSGTSYAVIAPNSLQVKIPIVLNEAYDYKLVYKKELKYGGKVLAVSDVSYQYQNDTVQVTESSPIFTTDCKANNSDLASKINPSVYFINNTDKSIRVYNGQNQLSNYSSTASDYVLLSGNSAMFTGLSAGATLSQLQMRSTAWTNPITNSADNASSLSLELGKVYIVTVTGTTTSEGLKNCTWSVTTEDASKYYTDEQ